MSGTEIYFQESSVFPAAIEYLEWETFRNSLKIPRWMHTTSLTNVPHYGK